MSLFFNHFCSDFESLSILEFLTLFEVCSSAAKNVQCSVKLHGTSNL